jgi:hypothetical protein
MSAPPETARYDRGTFVVDVPVALSPVSDTAEGVWAWATEDLDEQLLIGGYGLPGPANPEQRDEVVAELVRAELGVIADMGQGRVVVRRSERAGPEASLAIVTGVDATHGVTFAYFFIVTRAAAIKLKYARLGIDVSEREILLRAARVAGSLGIRDLLSPS